MVHPQLCSSRTGHTAAASQLRHVLCLTTQRGLAKTDGTIDRVANDTDGTVEETKRAKDTDGSATPTKGAANNTKGATENMNREAMEDTDGGAMQTVDRLPDATNGVANTMDDRATVDTDGGATENTYGGVHVLGTRQSALRSCLPDATNGIAHTMDDGATVKDGGATADDRGVPGTRESTLGIQCRSMDG